MFANDGSIAWIIYISLNYNLINTVYIIVALLIGYLFSLCSKRSYNRIKLSKLFSAIVISQLLVIITSSFYIGYKLNWSVAPNLLDQFRFFRNINNFIFLGFLSELGLLFCLFLLKLSTSFKWSEFGFRNSEVNFPFIIGFSIFGLCFSFFICYCFWFFGHPVGTSNKYLIELTNSGNLSFQIKYIIWLVFIVPLIEEAFFRGIVFNFFMDNSSLLLSIVLQALLFSLIHTSNSIELLLHFINGLFFGYLFFKSKSIFPSIFMHSAYNFLSIALTLL